MDYGSKAFQACGAQELKISVLISASSSFDKQWKSPIRLHSVGLAASFLSGGKLAYGVRTRCIPEALARPQASGLLQGHWKGMASEVLGRVVGARAQGSALGLWASSSSF